MCSTCIEHRFNREYLKIEAWNENVIRVRATKNNTLLPFDWVLQPKNEEIEVKITESEEKKVLVNGKLTCEFLANNRIIFKDTKSDRILLEEVEKPRAYRDVGRILYPVDTSSYHGETRFKSDDDEKIFGVGQHQHNRLNQKGCIIDLQQFNSEVTVPVIYSSRGYGFFWNNPAIGRVEFGMNKTRWVANVTDQIDYFVVGGDSPAEIMKGYSTITGMPSKMPEWATGFWQCKLRYKNRDELMEVANKHVKEYGLPMSVIVIDFFHWDQMGNWDFDPACWPDPEGMIKELDEMGIKLMVSIWVNVNPNSRNFQEMQEKGYLIRTDRGLDAFFIFTDTYEKDNCTLYTYDSTNPEARQFHWDVVKKNYCERGVTLYWLDVCEPMLMSDCDNNNIRLYLGSGSKVSSLYPYYHGKAYYDNMLIAGDQRVLNLSRSAWAGNQSIGTCVWSGDIDSTFLSLRKQIKAGLNMSMSGIPWWTTDIGGFYGGKIKDPEFRELVVRWFQFSLFCPIFRLHGFRDSWDFKVGGDNEVWSFGDEAFKIIKDLLAIREQLRPYIMEQMELSSETGTPPMRPLFFDFTDDERCFEVEDQFLFGPDILFAPIAEYKQRERSVYLPKGATWYCANTGKEYQGGQEIQVYVPLNKMAVFTKNRKKFWR